MKTPIRKAMRECHASLWLLLFLSAYSSRAGSIEDRWWPLQVVPKAIVRTENQQEFPEPHAALQILVQSIAGLAAKAVNEKRGDELVWVDNGKGDLEEWYLRFLARHPNVEKHGIFSPWQLVDRYAQRGLIKGYILYRFDKSKGGSNTYRPEMDCSVNVATSLSGLLDGIIVDEALEAEARKHGLKLLIDVRKKTQTWCFQTYKDQFNRHMLCTQDPAKPHTRDLAIAQKAFTVFGKEGPLSSVMEWLEPLSPILGWNGGDEFETTELSTSYGHIQTATDWCLNLPVLMAGSENLVLPKAKALNPSSINWNDKRSAVSFVDTDGDNVQWFQGNFFGNKSYWANPERGIIPFGWSTCFAQLAQLCPQAIEYAVATRSTNDWFIEWGGGYYYPDHFGRARTNRWDLLAKQARRTWGLMKETNTRIIGFNCTQYDSAEARRAYEVIAGQTDGCSQSWYFSTPPMKRALAKRFG
jgi:hypothetical protein